MCSFKVPTKRAHSVIVTYSWGDVIIDVCFAGALL
jgi:hypothetical protein